MRCARGRPAAGKACEAALKEKAHRYHRSHGNFCFKDNKNNTRHSDETNEIESWRAIPHTEFYVWRRSALTNEFVMSTSVIRETMVRNTISSKILFRSYHPQRIRANLWNLWRK